MSRTNRRVPATATVKCKRCGTRARVRVTGRQTVTTLGQIHSATQHGNTNGLAQRKRRWWGG
jgi:hypothetical protein